MQVMTKCQNKLISLEQRDEITLKLFHGLQSINISPEKFFNSKLVNPTIIKENFEAKLVWK